MGCMASVLPHPSGEKITALALRVDAAASAADTALDFAHALVLTDEERSGPAGLVRDAFHYGESSRRSEGGGFFVPMMEGDGFCYPPHVREVPAEVGRIWGEVADQVTAPIARARLSDLCFEGRWGDVGARGRAAVDAYLEMSKVDVYALEENRRLSVAIGRVDWLGRALKLASKMGEAGRCELAATAIVEAARESLAREAAEPGVALGLIEALVDGGRAEAGELLEEARRRYAGGQWNTDHVLQLQLRRVGRDGERRRGLERARVVGLMDHAESCEPLVRMAFLRDATQLARDYGCTDLLRECTLRLQSIREEDLGLEPISVEIPIPAGAIEKGVQEILAVESWQEALRKLSSHPPSGNVAANRTRVHELMKTHPLRSLFPEEVLGGHGLPSLRVMADEDKLEALDRARAPRDATRRPRSPRGARADLEQVGSDLGGRADRVFRRARSRQTGARRSPCPRLSPLLQRRPRRRNLHGCSSAGGARPRPRPDRRSSRLPDRGCQGTRAVPGPRGAARDVAGRGPR
jgi:hypothetical protein